MTTTEKFCQILRERSIENLSAGRIVFDNELYGQVISILRQELDSLVRVIFLLDKNLTVRQHYIGQTLSNIKWTLPDSRAVVTDRQMVDLSDMLYGWTKSVYKLGCAFVHLSPMANYKNDDPFQNLPSDEIVDIKQHLHVYHSFPLDEELTMQTIIPYLMRVLDKVYSNLNSYIDNLETDSIDSI